MPPKAHELTLHFPYQEGCPICEQMNDLGHYVGLDTDRDPCIVTASKQGDSMRERIAGVLALAGYIAERIGAFVRPRVTVTETGLILAIAVVYFLVGVLVGAVIF